MTSLMLKDDPYIERGRILAIPIGYPLNFNALYGGIFAKDRSQYRLSMKFLEDVEL